MKEAEQKALADQALADFRGEGRHRRRSRHARRAEHRVASEDDGAGESMSALRACK